MLEADGNVESRDAVRSVLGPFDQHERFLGQNLVPSDVRELVGSIETIEVEMKHRRLRRTVLMDERKRRTRHLFSDTVAATDCLGERRLPGAELAGDGDNEWRM